jgi:hypothetical protein
VLGGLHRLAGQRTIRPAARVDHGSVADIEYVGLGEREPAGLG